MTGNVVSMSKSDMIDISSKDLHHNVLRSIVPGMMLCQGRVSFRLNDNQSMRKP